jgi:hypothetical protein
LGGGPPRGIYRPPAGATAVVAATGGDVRFAGTAGSSGLTVSVRTTDGRYDTSYLHLSSASVREGDRVEAGQRLGAVGTTGTRSASAPHLHFGVRDAGSRHAYHDPLGFLPPPTATEPPRGAPAPQPVPVPVSPAPAPVRVHAPATRRIPVRAPAPRRVPAGEPRRVPAGEPQRVPAREPRRVPAGEPGRVPVGAPGRAPVGEPDPAPARVPDGVPAAEPRRVPEGAQHGVPAREPHRVLAREPHGAQAGAPRPDPVGTRSPLEAARGEPGRSPEHVNPPPSSGPDFGLLAACLGLLAAAALLGLTGEGRKATRETQQRIARALQPMLGRR